MKNLTSEERMVQRAALVAEISCCRVEEAYRYLMLCERVKNADNKMRSQISGLPIELIERLDSVMLWHVFI